MAENEHQQLIKIAILEIRPDLGLSQINCNLDELDSFDIISLVTILEKKFNVKIPGLEITPENFHSLEAILNLLLIKIKK
jgi:acyl carrier protein